MCSLLSSQSREVVKAAFGFIKITIRVLPSADLVPHLEDLIAGVLQWSSDPKSHFRLKARVIIERLCRKFGSVLHSILCGDAPVIIDSYCVYVLYIVCM